MKKQMAMVSLAGILSLSACVPAKKYNDLKTNYSDLEEENNQLERDLTHRQDQLADKTDALEQLREKKAQLQSEYDDLKTKKDVLQQKHDKLTASYDALEENSSAALKENSKKNRELLSQIEEKQEKLAAEKSNLEKLQRELEGRGKRIEQLEDVIAAKEQHMQELKESVSSALTDFEGKGLHVHRKNGKVYVSMENKLLFSTGSWAINENGTKAVEQLAEVLGQNPDIHVLIEGHTDNVPFKGAGQMKNNWGLSARRSISVVQILMNNERLDPKNLTIAGRSKYAPVASNNTAEGRAKNRRIEVILSPKLGKIKKLLQTDTSEEKR